MKFFDYLYFRVCKAYSSAKDSSPEGAAVCVVALMQCINLIFVLGILAEIFHFYFTPNKLIAAIAIVIVMVLNAFHYNRLNYDILNERWGNEDAKTLHRKGATVLIYILLSIISVIVLIVWRANTN